MVKHNFSDASSLINHSFDHEFFEESHIALNKLRIELELSGEEVS